MGGEVGRLWLNRDRLQFDVISNAGWTTAPWVNIGAVDDVVVLSGMPGERRFFDEKTGTWTDAPALRQMFDRSPLWIERMEKDQKGTIWATHDDGVVRFTPNGKGYDMDTDTFDFINDRFPVVHVLPGDDVWVSATQSLYHVEAEWATGSVRASKPKLVSLVDVRNNLEMLTFNAANPALLSLPFANNSLVFHFYSGSDAWQRVPVYEYKLAESEPWTALAGSQLGLRDLREGKYQLLVRLREEHVPTGLTTAFAFEIQPPWYHTWPAYIAFGTMALLLVGGLVRSSIYLERRRNRMLERVVHERTSQLEEAMARSGEETRNAATLAERDRLANEIHDSVQQGLTGAILQLDTTLKLPTVSAHLR